METVHIDPSKEFTDEEIVEEAHKLRRPGVHGWMTFKSYDGKIIHKETGLQDRKAKHMEKKH